MWSWTEEHWPIGFFLALVLTSLVAVAHAALTKRDVRAAMAWVGLILLAPGIGALMYLLLGINRLKRRAGRKRRGIERIHGTARRSVGRTQLAAVLAAEHGHLAQIARVVDRSGARPLLAGNRLDVLENGDRAYPAMLTAIDEAKHSVALASYIFDRDAAGFEFIDALIRAHERGVAVRILLDDAGSRYSFPPSDRALSRRGVPTARFLPVWVPWSIHYANLRNHRKIMVVDGQLGFTGGMNIRQGCVLAQAKRGRTQDVHFAVRGPVVAHLMEVFAEDWLFATRERLSGRSWYPELGLAGASFARGIADGPDEDEGTLRRTLLGAIASARSHLRIVTPYFLPDEALFSALEVAALRGVEVDLVLPARGNLRVVEWAMWAEIGRLLGHGCRVWLSPPPFDHSKLFTVDGAFALIGSANWDARSLRLNFEFVLEVYDPAFAREIELLAAARIARSLPLAEADLLRQKASVKLRNGLMRLFSPYL